MNYTLNQHVGSMGDMAECLMIPHGMQDFYSEGTRVETDATGKKMLAFHGLLHTDEVHQCRKCSLPMHANQTFATRLRHLPFGPMLSFVTFTRRQFRCPQCGCTVMENVPFRAEHHRITVDLEKYTEDLLAYGYTNKEVSELTGLAPRTVKDIDLARLRRKYTTIEVKDGKEVPVLKKPEQYARFLAIDEFKLHNNYRYATHIIDLETGHILWIGHGKTKQVVFDFMEHVGEEWMEHVEAVACDMNSDFQEAFETRCEWIQPVFDRFHIIKNFNEKVVSAVRIDEQKRLLDIGDKEGAAALKRSKYIMTSNRSTLQQKDAAAEAGEVIAKKSELFHLPEVRRHGGYEAKYDSLLTDNKLLFTLDLVKEQLTAAFAVRSEMDMADILFEIIDTCLATQNEHFFWFAKLLEDHFTGIIAHASLPISSGKIEGINNRIKTIRRQAYGFPDDEYFFLKLVDASRKPYVRNPPAHMFFN